MAGLIDRLTAMSASPTVSVIVTCYNLGQYLNEAVDSVLGQTYQDFEIVIINDGSTDADTNALLASYDRPRTRVVHTENRGLSAARNEGIRQTTGPYVCTLDADDLLERTYLEKAVARLDGDPAIAFVSHWLRTFGVEEREWKPTSADFPALLDMNTINGAALVRRTALLTVGGYDESMRDGCEDWDLWIGMVERGLRGTILPEVLFFYRQRIDSMSRVMMQGQTHVNLYRYLIDKHRPTFEAHATDLLLRRERDWAGLMRESHELELDCATGLGAENDRLRDNLRVAERKLERLRTKGSIDVELARRQRVMTDMDAELARRQCVMTEMDAELASRQETMIGMDRVIKQRDQVLNELHTELAHRGRLLDEKEGALVAMDGELSRREQTITAQTAELEWRAHVLSERNEEVTSVHNALQRDREGIAGLHREIQMMRGSLSWRLTRPLRAVYSRLFERK